MEFESGFRCKTTIVAVRCGERYGLLVVVSAPFPRGCREKETRNFDEESGSLQLDRDLLGVLKRARKLRLIAAYELSRKHRLLDNLQEICRAVSFSTSLMAPPHRGSAMTGLVLLGSAWAKATENRRQEVVGRMAARHRGVELPGIRRSGCG